MRRRLTLVSIVLIVALLLAVFADPSQRLKGKLLGQAEFDGFPTVYWQTELESGPGRMAVAQEKLEAGGEAAVAVLSEVLKSAKRPETRWKTLETISKIGSAAVASAPAVQAAMDDRDEHVRGVAIAAIPKIGITADVAVPKLIPLLEGEHSIAAARAISEYRAKGFPALVPLERILRDEKLAVDVRWNASRTIGKIGPQAVTAVPTLIEFLSDKEATIREHCAEALGDIGPGSADLGVPALIPLLKDSNTKVRRDTVRSFGQMGPKSVAAIEEIRAIKDDPEEIVRDAVAKTLEILEGTLVEPKKSTETIP